MKRSISLLKLKVFFLNDFGRFLPVFPQIVFKYDFDHVNSLKGFFKVFIYSVNDTNLAHVTVFLRSYCPYIFKFCFNM